jgi:hypothetical protein
VYSVSEVAGDGVHLGGELGHGEPARGRGQGDHGPTGRHASAFSFRSTPPTRVAPTRGAGGQLIEGTVADESGIHAVQGGGEPFGYAAQLGEISGNFSIMRPHRSSAMG